MISDNGAIIMIKNDVTDASVFFSCDFGYIVDARMEQKLQRLS